MTGFYGLTELTSPPAGVEGEQQPGTMNHVEIDAVVRNAGRVRSQALGSMLRRLVATWASLVRRPGRAVPSDLRHSKSHA